ncbi:MAG: response regulator [Chloroflexota bacterium]|nr:response regulator [Chloroflexota bacterium]
MSANCFSPTSSLPTAGDSSRSRPLVLIVEDDRDNAHLIARVLTGAKCDVLVTSVGHDALQHARTILPDVITLDLRLPDIDGLDLLEQLKATAETREIPVIVVSIVADERDPRLVGAFATLPKPIDRRRLSQTVEAALRTPQQQH